MKKIFKLEDNDLKAITDISYNHTIMYADGDVKMGSLQKKAHRFWEVMAKKYGFDVESVEPSHLGQQFFLATPKILE